MTSFIEILKGGRGSGNFGHGGRPGKRGGSGRSRRPKMNNTTIDNEVREHTPYRGNDNNNKMIEDIEGYRSRRRSNDPDFPKIVSSISKRSGASEDDVRSYISAWNSAVDFRSKELLIKSVNEELGVGLSAYERNIAEFSPRFNSKSEKIRNKVETNKKITRAMYEETQNRLKNLGVDHVIVYRGLREVLGEVGDDARYRANSAESWTFDQDKADGFADSNKGGTIKAKIPANRILSYANTGAGTEDEMEIVILGKGSSDSVLVTKVAEFNDEYEDNFF